MLKTLALKIRNKRALKKNVTSRKSTPFDKANNIGLLVQDYQRDKKAIAQLVDQLKHDGKHVQIVNFISDSDISNDSSLKNITAKDIDWKGKITSPEIEKFVKTDFDYLFSLHTSSFLPFENILARSKAKCRVGHFIDNKEDFFEIMVEGNAKNDLIASSNQMLNITKHT